ncbi:MAG: TRAP transporter large permease [Chloroflexota bacterium]
MLDPLTVGILGLAVFLILVLLGTWIGFAAATVGLFGIALIKGWPALAGAAGYIFYAETASFTLSVIPLFILMGYFAGYGGLTRDIFYTARQWLGHFPGGLAIATAFGCAGFGACSGSSTATAAVMGKVAIPEMKRYNYDMKLATGTVAASGTMAAMIPPSVIMVVYGVLTEQSVGTLLIAGFVPGIMEAVLYSGMIYFRCRFNPKLGAALPPASWKERIISLKEPWGILVLIIIIMGGIYGGVFTPTEAGGIGAFGAFCIVLARRKLTWANLKESLLETGKTTAMIFVTLVGILILLRLFALSGITDTLISGILGLPWPPVAILILILILFIFLGMFIAPMAMLMLTLPLVFPVILKLGYDPIWFGVIAVTMCELAWITPPVAMNVYVVKAVVPEVSTDDIFRGVMWFFLMDIIRLAIMVAFPAVVLWLPYSMKG